MKRKLIVLICVLLVALIASGSVVGLVAREENGVSGTPAASSPPPADNLKEPEIDNASQPKTDKTSDLYRLNAGMEAMVSPYAKQWQAFTLALQEQQSSFTFLSTEEKDVLLQVAASLPHAALFAATGEGLNVTLQYDAAYNDRCELLQGVTQSILRENVYADANDLETAVLLYSYLVVNMEEDAAQGSLCAAFEDYRANTAAFSGAFVFLLSQFDIPCAVVRGEKGVFAAAVLGGQCLYFSPCEESRGEYLRGLSSFGLTQTQAQARFGRFAPPAFAEETSGEPSIAGVFDGCTDWRLDVGAHCLYLAYGNSGFTVSIATGDMSPARG